MLVRLVEAKQVYIVVFRVKGPGTSDLCVSALASPLVGGLGLDVVNACRIFLLNVEFVSVAGQVDVNLVSVLCFH